ncbi:MAG: hypothetical protein AB7O37_00885 [Vicinamibacteria bacterium]
MSTNTCAGLRSALADAGVGGPTSPALEAHLAGCASCRAELEAARRLSRAIDEELRATLAVEPSPALLPRVRARVEEPASGGLLVPRWLGWAAATLALAAGAFLASRAGGPREPTAEPRVARALPAQAAPPRASAEPSAGSPASPSAMNAREAATQPPVPAAGPRRPGGAGALRIAPLPRVLVPADEERALLLFVAGLQRRRVEPGSLLAGVADAPPLEDLALGSISVEPLTMTPLGRTE